MKPTKIHIYRAEKEINQTELAKEVGCSRQTIHAIESGKWEPNISLANKIAKFFGKTIEQTFKLE